MADFGLCRVCDWVTASPSESAVVLECVSLWRAAFMVERIAAAHTLLCNLFRADGLLCVRSCLSCSPSQRWNGRHVMAGWVILVATGYIKGHGLIPNASVPLDLKQWGTLAALGNQQPITNERAIILIAHVHLLFVSVAAALAPFAFQDKLLLAPGEEDEKPAGLIPPLTFGLTKDAEMWNGRVAMLGLMVLVGASVATKTSILDTLNAGLGNLLF